MPPRARLTKHAAPGTDAAMEDVEISGWERSKLSNQDKRSLKKLGLMKKKDSLIFPSDESAPNPPIGYRNHQVLSSLPPLPEGGEVDERAIVHDNPGRVVALHLTGLRLSGQITSSLGNLTFLRELNLS
ncbi:hypothetical protein QYE76_004469 [Lolium multiflorum]|uniref:Uncharacterized protein n=1 Tax=Lolium multiflorum TaxID=4521 RepID=A0AAD8W1F5_LOLMU|nr:hypothetical protein QYE76_004469 [Lolium multiflorum]